MQIAAFAMQPYSPLPGRVWCPPVWARRGALMRDDGAASAGTDPAAWILAIAVKQDRSAFAALFAMYAPRIKTMLMRTGASADAAEEFAQETLLTIWRKAAQYDPCRASASAWVYTIARNLRIDRLRYDKRANLFALHETIEPELPELPDDMLNTAEREQRLRDALGKLPEEQIRVVRLSYFEGRAHGDIAKILDLPLGTVKSRLRLAVERLRHSLGELT
jgi:RNA polymerase sigma-70 factor, ECF subfamily